MVGMYEVCYNGPELLRIISTCDKKVFLGITDVGYNFVKHQLHVHTGAVFLCLQLTVMKCQLGSKTGVLLC